MGSGSNMNRRSFLQRGSVALTVALFSVGLSADWLPKSVKERAALGYLTLWQQEFYKKHGRAPREFLVTSDLFDALGREVATIPRIESNKNNEVFAQHLMHKSVVVSRSSERGWRVVLAS